ncbi:16S rRNA (uracil(1498)-N(3))-methyltransferase [Streptosporangium nondiastaticum]|uniref:Ribosomal RNA small subunit methyltransferase E n=2 Tax=Actinomycetes TaxID=1760 RepID=A0A9X7PFS0_9ACTN|nr:MULTISPECIES: 16S rRNA (uracil(1498)-N(3))-methyltransferase [Actinomycetes]PSJ26212.1 16S rRNA (uracil(1498)-N(3))-methyltransferase [Streptosporangium nondiastaticum]WKU44783.1 16S rRNA (uracil(1498)-N(3))-methyltransferase [Streptomyces sp. VNUA116]
MTAPVFLVEEDALTGVFPGTVFPLDGPEGRHAVSVRRLRVGEEIGLTDGQGTGAFGTVAAVEGKDRLDVAVTSVRSEPLPEPRITVVQALPKGDRGEVAVETMTETGVDAVVPWAASRCITQWKGDRGLKSLGKWRATAREAGKQSRRLRFPTVSEPMTTRQVAQLLADAAFAAVLHEEGHSAPLATAPLPATGDIVLVVGPEGGVSPEELAAFAEAGAKPYRLGASVLRTSTAGTAATALLLGRTGRWS